MAMLDNLPPTYEPKRFEADIRRFWETGGYFHAEPDAPAAPADAYTIVIPPPNVTGALHGGHALNNTLQDILIRWHRMRGFNTLWMPGTDHAGIATQAVVERTIFEKERKTRHDLGREEMVRRIWEWKEAYGNRIIEQLKLMGCSCDWERTRFTLDDICARAVRHTFFKLFKDGLIVRGKRLVNWDTHLQTAVADDEVYHESTKGHFYHFKYPVKPLGGGHPARLSSGGAGVSPAGPSPTSGVEHASEEGVQDARPPEPQFVHIATTRPETMLGDTAVAVHPDPEAALNKVEQELRQQLADAPDKEKPAIQAQLDEIAERRRTILPTLLVLRDMALAGRKLILPLVDREIPLIADEWAKPELGSGCVKITPAHDPNDYDVYQRHPEIGMISVMTPDGKVAPLERITNEAARKYEGLKFNTDARKAVVADLKALGLVEKIEDRLIEIGHSDRSKTPIEPFMSDQWFVRMGDLTEEEAAQVQSTHMRAYLDSGGGHPARLPSGGASVSPAGLSPASGVGSASEEGVQDARPPRRPGLAQLAMDAVAEDVPDSVEARRDSGKVHFFPGRYRKTYLDWLGEKRDWCISRQLWWGHRIPVWTRDYDCEKPEDYEEMHNLWSNTEVTPLLEQGEQLTAFIVDLSSGRLLYAPGDSTKEFLGWFDKPEVRPHCRVHVCYIGDDSYVLDVLNDFCRMEQDPDVLDTWFSSALWPHSTLGWPEQTAELSRYYPGSVLSTAREIITLWVARMVLTGMYNIGRVPFHDVYIHAVIQDGQGRPFKKTLGNGFDPVDIIETYGADALRFTMASLTTETQDIRMPMKKVKLDDGRELQSSERFELGRNFCNKLWNASRFAFMNLEGAACEKLDVASLPIEDRWILSQASKAVAEVQNALLSFQFSRAVTAARDFFWDTLCDWYLELVKPRMNKGVRAAEARQVLAFVLDQSLRLLHPFVPYITEALWKFLNEIAPQRGLPGIVELDCGDALIRATYPPVAGYPSLAAESVDAVFADLQTATRAVRDVRQTRNVPPKQKVDVVIKVPAGRVASLQGEAHVIQKLANVGELTIGDEVQRPPNAATLVIGDLQIFVANVIDAAAEKARLEKDLAGLDKQIGGLAGKLGNADFVSRAPAEVVEKEKARLADLQAKRETVVAAMAELG